MFRQLFFLLAALCCALSALADTNPPPIETSKQFNDYTVYYNVFPSIDLLPEVAARYQIARANDSVVVNVSLRNARRNNGGAEAAASVSGTYSDLMATKKLEFREIREPDAVYYIAQLRVTNRELLRFDISVVPAVTPDNDGVPTRPLAVTFTRKFAVDSY
jgi:hypothetical protein